MGVQVLDSEAKLLEKIETLTRLVAELDDGVVLSEKLSAVTATQLSYLKAIDKLSYPTLSELAQKLNLAKPTVTNGVNKLVDRGLVHKLRSTADKRVFHIHITPKGKALVEAYKEVYRDYASHLVGILNQDEIEILIRLFTKIIEASPLNRI